MEERRTEEDAGDDVPHGFEPPPQPRRMPPPPRAAPTDAELQEMVDAVVEPLHAAGVPAGRFTVHRILDFGLTVDQFVRHTKAVFGGRDADYADLVISAGIKAGVCESMRTLDVSSLWWIIRWARSNEGRQALETKQQTKKLEDKRVGSQSVQDVALCQILNLQTSMMAEEVKESRESTQNEIDELARLLRLKRTAQARALDEAKARYFPASTWEEPSEVERNNKCWEAYVTAMRNAGQPNPAKSEVALKSTINAYKEYVDIEFKTVFVRSEERRIALQHFADERVRYLSSIGDSKKAENFRRLLASLGVEPTVTATDEEEERDDEENTGGEADDAGGEGAQPEVGGRNVRSKTVGKGSGRGKGKARVTSERRDLRPRKTRGGDDVQIPGSQGATGTSGSQHRHR